MQPPHMPMHPDTPVQPQTGYLQPLHHMPVQQQQQPHQQAHRAGQSGGGYGGGGYSGGGPVAAPAAAIRRTSTWATAR